MKSPQAEVVNIGDMSLDGASGVLHGFATEQLNANFVMLDDGESISEHRNDEVDVVLVVQAGDGSVVVDGVVYPLRADSIALIPRNTLRSITAVRRLLYFTIHQRRAGLGIKGEVGGDPAASIE